MQKIRKRFPVLSHCIYANTAAYGLLNEGLTEWRQEHDLDILIGGSATKIENLDLISDTKQTIGNFFGCKRKNVALVSSFSIGLNILLEGLDKKHRVLLLQDDYPSVNWPFESRGFPISYARIDEHLEQNIRERIIADDISILALSLVQWLSGIRIDMDFLKVLKEDHPNLIIIADGTQFCGAFDLNFELSGIDILGASGYKWLLAGSGNGFLLFKEGAENFFSIKTTGFNSANANLDRKDTFRFSKHFEPGHLDSLNFGSINYTLGMLTQIGKSHIELHNQKLVKKAKAAFQELGLLDEVILKRKQHSSIFNIKGNDQMYRHLVDNNVVCSQRGAGIRLSFHFYNSENEIEQIADILKLKH